MVLGALVDAGFAVERLQAAVTALGLPGVSVSAEKVKRKGIAATKVHVHVTGEAASKHRHLSHIEKIIDAADWAAAGFSSAVPQRAKAVFRRLAEAEAQVHATSVEKVHFHEVGANDAIVDIVGACAGVDALGLDVIQCSPFPLGSGAVACEHGVMPVPAPATALLLRGVPVCESDEPGELVTPTGAAILTTLTTNRTTKPRRTLTIDSIGYGAGSREGHSRPNVLRLSVLRAESHQPATDADCVSILEANLDDADGQLLADAALRLFDAGAIDVYFIPILMKKGRPGQLLTVLCPGDDHAKFEELIFRLTPTFGIRHRRSGRSILDRSVATVSTPYGDIRVKVGRRSGKVLQVWPEYEDCAAAAASAGVTLRQVQAAALAVWKD